MAAYSSAGAGAIPFITKKLKQRKVMLFTKKHDPECKKMRTVLEKEYKFGKDNYEVCEIESRQDVAHIENYFHVLCLTDTRSVPQLFVNSKYIGGEKEIPRMHESGELKKIFGTAGALALSI